MQTISMCTACSVLPCICHCICTVSHACIVCIYIATLASRKASRGRKLQPGDLAYVIERGLAKKISVTGPFVVGSISRGQVHLPTTRRVPDQEVRYFSIHIERVARCTTITDVLEKLLRAAAYPAKTSPDHEAAQHTYWCSAAPIGVFVSS